MIQMATNGVRVGDYRPGDTDQALDIIVRYPKAYRSLEQLKQMRVSTAQGLVPLSLFVTREPQAKVTVITRQNGRFMYKVEANPKPGEIADNILQSIMPDVKSLLSPAITIELGGDKEQQVESQVFLMNAFGIALFMMTIILVTQFNSFYQAGLILSAVVFSTAGVFLTLLIKGEPFGIVMSGVGVIALSGIVVNNNIVLIDTYKLLIREGASPYDAAIETCKQRLRPVLLTTVTTVLGLLPMVFQINIALLEQDIALAPPSAQWWTQLSMAIAGGLLFATILTLFVTPAMLLLAHRPINRYRAHSNTVNTD
jgi:multidrug efflux pump